MRFGWYPALGPLCYPGAVADLGFDGVYARAEYSWIGWLRFFSDGAVLQVSNAPTAVGAILRWLRVDERGRDFSRGQWSQTDDAIEMATTSSAGTVEYRGRIADGGLRLDIHSLINGYRAHDLLYRWIPCSPGDLAGDWSPEIEAGRLADALAAGGIEEPALRLAATLGSAEAAQALAAPPTAKTPRLDALVRQLALEAGDEVCLALVVTLLDALVAEDDVPVLDALKDHLVAPLSRELWRQARDAGIGQLDYPDQIQAAEVAVELVRDILAGGTPRRFVPRVLGFIARRRLPDILQRSFVPWLLGYHDLRHNRSLVEKSALFEGWARDRNGRSALTEQEAALIADVTAPDAPDQALLIYADWLEERGNPKRGYLQVLARLHDSRLDPAVIEALRQRWRRLANLPE